MGDFPLLIKPAGVTNSPNTAKLTKGVRTQRSVIYFPPGKRTERAWSTVGLMALPSRGEGYTPNTSSGTRNAVRTSSEPVVTSFFGSADGVIATLLSIHKK